MQDSRQFRDCGIRPKSDRAVIPTLLVPNFLGSGNFDALKCARGDTQELSGAQPTTGLTRGNATMADYKRLSFVAKAWKETLDPTTGERKFEAVDKRSLCDLEIEIIPGSEPPQVILHCVPDGCTTKCELVTEVDPNGVTDYFCRCVSDGTLSRAKKAKKRVKS